MVLQTGPNEAQPTAPTRTALLDGLNPLAVALTEEPAPTLSAQELRAALAGDQLSVHYQPQVDMATCHFVGVEALARWNHPELGSVSPAVFIPLAERTGQIDALSDWVFRRAMTDLVWCAAQGLRLRLALNCSVYSLKDISFPARVEALIRETGWAYEGLVLEVTETALCGNNTFSLEVLARLAMRGIKMSIDDFGTGYANLEQLDRMPFSELKIDHGFTARALEDEHTRIIVENSVELAHRLKLPVVVEGIACPRSWRWVRSMQSELGQGFFIARPMPRDALMTWAVDWSKRAIST